MTLKADLTMKARERRIAALSAIADIRPLAQKRTAPDGRVYWKPQQEAAIPGFVSSRSGPVNVFADEPQTTPIDRRVPTLGFGDLASGPETVRYLN